MTFSTFTTIEVFFYFLKWNCFNFLTLHNQTAATTDKKILFTFLNKKSKYFLKLRDYLAQNLNSYFSSEKRTNITCNLKEIQKYLSHPQIYFVTNIV